MKTQISDDVDWEDYAKRGEIKKAILSYVQCYDWVTFVELQSRLKPYCTVEGKVAIELFPNGIIWLNMSEELESVIGDLMSEKSLFLHPASTLSYMVDGGIPNIPVAKRKPTSEQGYKQPRWVPCCLRTFPPTAAKSKKK